MTTRQSPGLAPQSIANHISNWAVNLSVSDIPQPVMATATRCLVDTVGVIAAARDVDVLENVRRQAVITYAAGPCQTIGGPTLSAPGAALVNGMAAHLLDFDDTSYTGIMHGSAVSIPAVLAAGQMCNANGEEFLTALVVGLETTYTLARMATPEIYRAGWWTTATIGIPGAAAGVAKILGLSGEGIATAIGIAAVQAFGLRAIFGTDAKPYLAGRAAEVAISSALAAQAGVTGPHDAFENRHGFFQVIADPATARPDFVGELGVKWCVVEPGILFKRFPICSAAHAACDAIEFIATTHQIGPDDIANIRCEIPDMVDISLVYDDPQTAQQAQFSLPFAIAAMLHFGDIGPQHLTRQTLDDHALRATMNKVSKRTVADLANDPDAPEGIRLHVDMPDGRTFTHEVRAPLGMPQNPMDNDMLERKFHKCLSHVDVAQSDAQACISKLWNCRNCATISDFLP